MPGIASRGNSISITAPMHWTMVPDVWASAMVFFLVAPSEFGFPSHPLLILRRGAREAGGVVEGCLRSRRGGFPLPSPPHLEEGCPRSGRGGGGVPAQQAGWYARRPPPRAFGAPLLLEGGG